MVLFVLTSFTDNSPVHIPMFCKVLRSLCCAHSGMVPSTISFSKHAPVFLMTKEPEFSLCYSHTHSHTYSFIRELSDAIQTSDKMENKKNKKNKRSVNTSLCTAF